MTPVMGLKKPGTVVRKNDYFVPFVVNPRRAPKERTYFADGRIHILCIGKYEIRKHHLMLLRAVRRLKEKYKLKVTLVGEATNRFQKEYCGQVKDYVASHHMEDMITVKTNVARRDMEREYLSADLYVIPSTLEMASVSQLEAMSYSSARYCQRYQRNRLLCGGWGHGLLVSGLRRGRFSGQAGSDAFRQGADEADGGGRVSGAFGEI